MTSKEIGNFIKEERTKKGIGLSLLARELNKVSGSKTYNPAHLKLLEEGIIPIGMKMLNNLCLSIGIDFELKATDLKAKDL